jgi:hypothetical protein
MPLKLSDVKWIVLRHRRYLRKRFFKRHSLNQRVIALDITYSCNLKCFNCDRSCRQAPSHEQMTVDQVRAFVRETIEQNRKWHEIKIEGGEPTLHPEVFGIIDVLRRFRSLHAPRTRITLSTNGYGPEVHRVLARLPEDIIVYNSNKDGPWRTEFDAFNVAPADLDDFSERDFTCACDIPFYFGISLNRYGYYPCGVSGGIDRVFGFDLGRKSLPRKGDPMPKELSTFCRLCGHFIPFNRVVVREDISPTWTAAYERYGTAPPKLTLY